MSYSGTTLLALLVNIIINYNVIRNKHYRHESSVAKTYRAWIVSLMAFYTFDALWGVLYSAHFLKAVFFDTMLYFAAMSLSVFCWTRFVIGYLKEENRLLKAVSVTGWLMLGSMAVFLILNLFIPLIYWFDADGTYHAGTVRYFVLAIQILLFLCSSIYALLSVKRGNAKGRVRHLAIGAFGIVMSVMVVLQVLYPLLPLYAAGSLLGNCIIHTFVITDMEYDRRMELEGMIRRIELQELELGSAKHMAYTDSLTGVKNTHAYEEAQKQVDLRIVNGELKELGVVVFDLNGLKEINDTKGHDAGDQYIRKACRMICRQFTHSPVFRIGGDEFVVFLEGEDYKNRRQLLDEFDAQIDENHRNGDVIVASGLAIYRPGYDNSYRRIFERADQRMYDRKGDLKAMDV